MVVLATTTYKDNGKLILAAKRLGHLRREWSTLDMTYGHGVFWKYWMPTELWANNRDDGTLTLFKNGLPLDQYAAQDFREMSLKSESFDVVVLDPPYGLRGTSNDSNNTYGHDSYMSITARHEMIQKGLAEAARLGVQRVFLKCQDQVASGKIWWQTRIFSTYAEENLGLELVERLDMLGGYRKQPKRKRKDGKSSRQQHAYARPSSLLIFRKIT